MKEIIPLKKNIIFKSKISEITAIDVEHDYKIKDNLVEGKMLLTGSYKMTEASLIEEDFYYEIPFSIAIGEDVKKDTIKLEISDFKYDYEKDIMRINAELEFTCDKEEVNDMQDDIFNNLSTEDYFNDGEIKEEVTDINVDTDIKDNEIESKKSNINDNEIDIGKNIIKDNEMETEIQKTLINDNQINTTIKDKVNEINSDIEIGNITDNIISNDKNYNIYKVYIVREGDTVDSICAKYNVKYDDIKDYNNLNEINIGDKIIIPYINE